ncbi:MAG: 3',5'-cyclic-nucleotide phosphodiesterase [bacterium]
MRIRILPSASGDSRGGQYVTTYLIDDAVAIDAGCLGLYGTPASQRRISNVFLTHSHADHIASLPVFVETICAGGGSVAVYGPAETLRALSTDVFNDRIWPDYSHLPSGARPDVRFVPIEPEHAVEVSGLRVTPIPVDHSVVTFGYVVESSERTVVFGGDSGPTDRIWEFARRRGDVRAVFIETSFPNDMRDLALDVGHLTPELLREEIGKLPGDASIIVTHIKPGFKETIIAEIESLRLPRLEIGVVNAAYEF